MKIAICLPVHGDTRALFTYKLARMLVATHTKWASLGRDDQPEVELFMADSSGIAKNREWLATQAQNWKADAILWLDVDQTFPADTLLRLIGRNEPVVGANYPRREDAARPCARRLDPSGQHVEVYTTPEKIAQQLLEPISFMGLGVCLVSMDALARIERPYFSGENEDFYFFSKLRAAGIEPMLDHALSAEVGHIRNQVLTNDHSLAARAPRSMEIPLSGGKVITGKLIP
jgi:hypothetical protein